MAVLITSISHPGEDSTLHACFDPAQTLGKQYAADCLPQRASRFRADQDRQFSHWLQL